MSKVHVSLPYINTNALLENTVLLVIYCQLRKLILNENTCIKSYIETYRSYIENLGEWLELKYFK